MNIDGERLYRCFTTFERAVRPLLLLLVLALYTLAGAYIFYMIEAPYEHSRRKEDTATAKVLRDGLVDQLAGTNDQHRINVLLKDYQRKLEDIEFHDEDAVYDWTVWSAAEYSMSLYTTIGYGTIGCATTRGRVATVFYSLIGVPYFIYVLVELGRSLSHSIAAIWAFSCHRCSTRAKRFKKLGLENTELASLPVFLILTWSIAWLLVAALLYHVAEHELDYGLSLYFMVISTLTIGLGDIVPNDERFAILMICFVIIGLVLFSAVAHLIRLKIDAIYKALEILINQQNLALQDDPEGAPQNITHMEIKTNIGKMLSQLPRGSRFYYRLSSQRRKMQLHRYWQQCGKRKSTESQTDEYLLRPVQSRLQRIKDWGEDSQRSHDDVNSLIMMCEYPG